LNPIAFPSPGRRGSIPCTRRGCITTQGQNQRITDWNRLAPQSGASGRPGFVTRPLVEWVLYPKSVREPVNSLFEAIEQGEGTGPFAV